MVEIRCEVNGKDISEALKRHMSYIDIVDKDGTTSDELNIGVTDAIKRPAYDDEIKIWINQIFYGTFLIQSTETNHLKELSIKATGTNFSNKLKVKKSKSYSDTTLKAVLEFIAKDHGLKANVGFSDVSLVNLIQEKESDLHFMNRLAKEYDAVFSTKNNTLVFIERSDELPMFTIDLNSCSPWNIVHSNRKAYGSCKANWRDTKTSTNLSVTVGDEEPVLNYNGSFSSEEEALTNARAKLQQANRGTKEGTLSKYGEYISAGSKVQLTGSAQDDGEYTIETVYTTIDRNGFRVSLDFKN